MGYQYVQIGILVKTDSKRSIISITFWAVGHSWELVFDYYISGYVFLHNE